MGLNALAYLIGSGSMTLGVERAGVNVSEIWETPGYSKNAQTWDLNRPDLKHQVMELDWANNHFSSYRSFGLDLVYGNPPCGGMSSMTGSKITSETNNCMRKWIRMVVQARPRMILMENGYQLDTVRMLPLLSDLTDVLDEHGYWWWTWKMYSYQLGTPQVRRRMFLCASLHEPKNLDLIDLSDIQNVEKTSAPVGPYIENLVGIEPSPHDVIDKEGRLVTQHWYDQQAIDLRDVIRKDRHRLEGGYTTPGDVSGMFSKLPKQKLDAILRKYPLWEDVPRQLCGFHSHRPRRVRMDLACPAIIGTFRYVHPIDDRFLTMREMSNIMGYPSHWQFHKLRPHLIAQGIPVNSARWATERLMKVVGLEEKLAA